MEASVRNLKGASTLAWTPGSRVRLVLRRARQGSMMTFKLLLAAHHTQKEFVPY